jgi:hypothetical protein
MRWPCRRVLADNAAGPEERRRAGHQSIRASERGVGRAEAAATNVKQITPNISRLF